MNGFEQVASYDCYFAQIAVFERFMIATPVLNNYSAIDRTYLDYLDNVQRKHYRGPWGYIGNRINNNPGHPGLFHEAKRRFPNWSSFALVSYSDHTTRFYEIEKLALKGIANQLFRSLDEAMRWTDELIRELQDGEEARADGC